MASWVIHSMIADRLLGEGLDADRRGFAVGNIAPDCNLQTEDGTSFVPTREETHWMSRKNDKLSADCEGFYRAKIDRRTFSCEEERSFFLGYYVHLISDVEFQRMILDEGRLNNVFERVRSVPDYATLLPEGELTYPKLKAVFDRAFREADLLSIEAEYLAEHPESVYRTEIQSLTAFPDYLDNFPKGAILRKIPIMATGPVRSERPQVFFTLGEIEGYVDATCRRIQSLLKA